MAVEHHRSGILKAAWAIVAVASVLVLYKSAPGFPFHRISDRPGDAMVLILLPLAMLGLSMYGLFARGRGKASAMLTVISTLVALYLCEGILLSLRLPVEFASASGYTARTYINHQEAKKLGVPFDYRTVGSLIEQRSKAGEECVPILSGHRLRAGNGWIVNHGGLSNTCTIFASNETGVYASYLSDNFGFANDEHEPNVFHDLILIGDSFAHGAAVAPENGIAGVLRQDGLRVLNLAISGTGPLRQMAIYREYGNGVPHGTLAWFFFEGNDIKDLRREWRRKVYRRYLDPEFSQDLRQWQQEIDDHLREYVSERLKVKEGSPIAYRRMWRRLLGEGAGLSNLRNAMNQLVPCGDRQAALKKEEVELLRETVALVSRQTLAHDSRAMLVYLPSWERFGGCGGNDKLRHTVKEIFSTQGFEIVDITEKFMEQPDPLALFPFRLSNHYNETGYSLVGRELASVLAAGRSGN